MRSAFLLLGLCIAVSSFGQEEEREIVCKSLPYLYFKKNSTEVADTTYSATQELKGSNAVLNYILQALREDDELDLVIFGHADAGEKNDSILSRRRALKVKDLLVKHGIDENRLSIRAEGAASPVIDPDKISAFETEEERRAARSRNRRVGFIPAYHEED